MNGGLSIIAGTIVTVALIASVTVLAWVHTIDGPAALTLLGTLAGGGVVIAHSTTTKR